jgi:hypothetical protein
MSEVHVEKGPAAEGRSATAEVEREVTKRALIEAVTSVVMVVLYMIFAFVRDRDPGVISLGGAADDWD